MTGLVLPLVDVESITMGEADLAINDLAVTATSKFSAPSLLRFLMWCLLNNRSCVSDFLGLPGLVFRDGDADLCSGLLCLDTGMRLLLCLPLPPLFLDSGDFTFTISDNFAVVFPFLNILVTSWL